MEIKPYDGRPVRVGDVAFFLPPEAGRPIVHRIVRVTPAGISTLGDNNTHEDPLLLHPNNIKGRVVGAWRGQKRRKIAGGTQGRLTSRWLRCRRILGRGVSPLLRPLYHALSSGGLIARVLPASWRPRVVVFHIRGRDQFQLLLGRRIIGRYDDQRQQWLIRRPFQLFVDGKALPRRQEKGRLNRQISMDRPRTMSRLSTQGVRYELDLADGIRWEIVAGDDEAASLVTLLGSTMRLPVSTGAGEPSPQGPLRRLLVQVEANASMVDCHVPLASINDGVAVCALSPSDHWGGPYVNLVILSLVFAREAQARGGVLIHGALAERDGLGVILIAPGGTGKTTASNRLPPPWRSLCDDATLVVRDPRGAYWAHPWPTWSRFLGGGPGGTWDVRNAVPVKGIFCLAQAAEDRVERVGRGQAVSLLGEVVGQISAFMVPGLSKEELRVLRLEQFNNLCLLARVVPVHVLHISLTGHFWQEIEQAL